MPERFSKLPNPPKFAGPRDEFILNEFVQDMQVNGFARRTAKEYAATIRRYLLATGKHIENSTYEDLRSYYLEIHGRGADVSHLNSIACSFRRFWAWYSEKYHMEDIAKTFKSIKRKIIDPYIPEENDINLAIDYCYRKATKSESAHHQFAYYENAAMIAFIIGTGVRVSELIEINIQDIMLDPTGNFFRVNVYSPKTRRQRMFDFANIKESTCVGEVFSLYWQYRLIKFNYAPDDPLFPSLEDFPAGHSRLTRQLVWERFRRISWRIGANINKPNIINPHSLRHFNATYLYLHGMDLREIQYRLGHAMLSTTERYVHLATRRRGTVAAYLADKDLKVPQGGSGFARLVRSQGYIPKTT